jgi:hypothetical protein
MSKQHNTVRGTPFTSRTQADNPGFRRDPVAPKREVRGEKLGEKGFRQEDATLDKQKDGRR